MLQIFVSIITAAITILYALHRLFPEQTFGKSKSEARLGLVLVSGHDEALPGGTDIIFVHGLGSNPATAWKSYSSRQQEKNQKRGCFSQWAEPDVCWVTDFLPADLNKHGRQKDRIFFYNYNSVWYRDAIRVQLADLAQQMLQTIHGGIRKSEKDRRRRLLFVAHSYGGLVVKEAIMQALAAPKMKSIADSTQGFIFLGTPHRGSELTSTGLIVAFCMRPFGSDVSILLELAFNSVALLKLDEKFHGFLKMYRKAAISFWESIPIANGIGPLVRRAFPAPKASAELLLTDELRDNVMLPLNHFQMNKFESTEDLGYIAVKNGLINILNPITDSICMAPGDRIETYLERTALSRDLDEILISPLGHTDEMQVAVLHGLGGTGKTQVALDFVQRHRDKFNPILWIDASSIDSIRESFESCVRYMRLNAGTEASSFQDILHHPAVNETLNFLSERGGESKQWLMVIDNADEESKEHIGAIMPNAESGKVIVTSQHVHLHTIPDKYRRLEVDLLSESEARSLLLRRLIGPMQYQPSELAISTADQIARCLEYLALAIDMIGAYILEQELDGSPFCNDETLETVLQSTLENLKHHRDEILDWPTRHSPYGKTVLTVWKQTQAAIESKYPVYVSHFFRLMAAFDNVSIEEELFSCAGLGFPFVMQQYCLPDRSVSSSMDKLTTIRDEGREWDRFYFDRAAKTLSRYRLVRYHTSSTRSFVSMHNLVHSCLQHELREDEWQTYHMIFHGAIAYRALQMDRVQNETLQLAFSHHLHVLNDTMRSIDYDTKLPLELFAGIWQNIAAHLIIDKSFARAECILRKVLNRVVSTDPEAEQIIVDLILRIGQCCVFQAKHDEATEMYADAREMMKYDSNNLSDTIIDWEWGRAMVDHERGHYQEALSRYLKLSQSCSDLYGAMHVRTRTVNMMVGKTLALTGQLVKAGQHITHCYEIYEHEFGPDHYDVQMVLSSWAFLLRLAGQFLEAEEWYCRIIDSLQKTLPEDHDSILSNMHDRANCLYDLKRNEEADELVARSKYLLESKRKRLHLQPKT